VRQAAALLLAVSGDWERVLGLQDPIDLGSWRRKPGKTAWALVADRQSPARDSGSQDRDQDGQVAYQG
jgi:hypothetical protein